MSNYNIDMSKVENEDPLTKRLRKIKHKIAVLSGKGGVGKSTVAANLALALAKKYPGKVGIMDIDITGPNIPLILGKEDARFTVLEGNTAIPVEGPLGLKIVSMAFLLQTRDTPVIWRGPLKNKAIEQFVTDFEWGELEYLIVDMPPGTGDETLTLMQKVPLDGVVIVTTPQEISVLDTSKSIQMVKKMDISVLGVIENMAGFICPSCKAKHYLFGKDGGKTLAKKAEVNFLGEIPIRLEIREKEDQGITEPFEEFLEVVDNIEKVIIEKQAKK